MTDESLQEIEIHDVFTYPGKYSSDFAMFSPLPPSRQKRSIDNDIIGSGYYISVSSNGQDFTGTFNVKTLK
jgi:hypothetical protein